MTYRRSSSRGAPRRRTDTIGVNDPYRNPGVRVQTVEPVRYGWPEWYTRVVTAEGKVWHWGPWKTEWAARHCAHLLARLFLQRGQLTGGVYAQ